MEPVISGREQPLDRNSVERLPKAHGLKLLLTGAPRLGDLLFAFPAIHHLLACTEIRELTVLCFAYAAPVLEGLENKVGRIEISTTPWNFLKKWYLVQMINKRGFDAAIVLDEKRSMLKLLARTTVPAVLIERSTGARKTEQHLRAMIHSFPSTDATGKSLIRCPVVKPTKLASRWAEDKTSNFGRPRIAFHVGCQRVGRKRVSFAELNRTATKLWLVERFLELGRMLIDRMGATVVMVGSGSSERAVAEEFVTRLGSGCINTVDWGDSMQTAALLQQTDVLVASDGGILHLGAAVGSRVVAIWGPTPIEAFGPCGPPERVRVLRREVDCRPCRRTECDDKICLSSISAEEVFAEIVELLPRQISG